MPSLIKLSEASVLGLHVMTRLAVEPGAVLSAPVLAKECGSSPAHLIKVCQRLARKGLVGTVRGKAGGFRLALPASGIRLSTVILAIDGPLKADGCLLTHSRCCHGKDDACIFGPRLARLQKGIAGYFGSTRVSQLARRCRKTRRRP